MTDGETSGSEYTIAPSAMPIREMPERLRPREEIDRVGVENVSDATLLAVLLGSGARGLNVADLATHLLRKYRSLSGLAETSVEELSGDREMLGLGPVKSQKLMVALEIGKRLREESLPRESKIRSPEDAVRLLEDRTRDLDKEVFWVFRLDAKHTVMGTPEEVSMGILDASLVHPREVFRRAIRESAAAVVLAHNHPSGDPTPSAEDVRITRQLVEAGKVVDIQVLDHVILARTVDGAKRHFVSMREEGLVGFSGD